MKTANNEILIRKSIPGDLDKIFGLYKHVSKTESGLARTESEITIDYIRNFTLKAIENGVQLVITDQDKIIGEIHCCKPEPKVFSHVLSELTIAVHADYQGLGLGKKLFKKLLDEITETRNDVRRIELIVRESNAKAIKLYEDLGFKKEGRLDDRIKTKSNSFEADIPMAWRNEKFEIK